MTNLDRARKLVSKIRNNECWEIQETEKALHDAEIRGFRICYLEIMNKIQCRCKDAAGECHRCQLEQWVFAA